MTRVNADAAAMDEDLDELRLLLPRIVKGLRGHRPALPPDLERSRHTGAFSGRHFLALMHLAQSDGLSVSDLAARLDVTLPTVSVVVHQLSDHGLVDLREDEADRRRTLVSITPSHREWVETGLAAVSAPLQRTLQRLQPSERVGLLQGLRILAEELSTHLNGELPAHEEIG